MPGGYIASGWQPLRKLAEDDINPEMVRIHQATNDPFDEVWLNDRYQIVVRHHEPTDDPDRGVLTHLSIHSHDRGPVRNWRHLQQIKNEVCGPERWAVEVFPAESNLVDTSNEYHLWVMPEGETIGFGFKERLVTTDEQAEAFNAAPHPGRQEPWEEGLTTGRDGQKQDILDLPPRKITAEDIHRHRRMRDE